ncbi:protein arginine kinase [Alkalicoccus daliensis]|uniref:Protein-arginine kinase n=1 Tax=Alkalicoccus daliensis TaxID=745820 RepID=A0A1H0L555_9BACI|nr:protein arginine kinase [Alkalicoccus daliensis]SDO63404.1 protein arginine kinase [Alkalicoccus daliensis]
MTLKSFMNDAISPWMKNEGPEADIAISSRVRLARNLDSLPYPIIASEDDLNKVIAETETKFSAHEHEKFGALSLLKMQELSENEKRVLVEKHLVSPHLTREGPARGVLLSEDESLSVMVNEEDHFRIQCLLSGFQLEEGLACANAMDDWMEETLDFAFDEKRGYLTSCPTNVGTGLRSSVMMHLPALVLTKQLNRILPAINQLGLVVRGIYGEGSEALGNLYQVSNQTTLGTPEKEIIKDLSSVVAQLIQHERAAREQLWTNSKDKLEDRIYRSYGILSYSRRMETKEAMERLSDVRLGIDMGIIKDVQGSILNELMVLTQPGFLQQYAGEALNSQERDWRRAALIRERLTLEEESHDGGGEL